MDHKEAYFNNQHGQSIFYQYWMPESKPKAALLVIHGLNEHSGRYAHFADFFTANGYSVFALDHIGHGKSDGTRSYIKKFSYYIDDIVTYIKMINDWFPDIPIYPVGHSLGGLINTYLLLDHQHLVRGAVLSGSVVLVPEYVSNFTIMIGKFISILFPKLGLLEIDKQSLSHDPEVVQAYINDPLVFNGKITVRVSSEMNDAIERISLDGEKITLPVLILHGSEDKIVEPECSKYLHGKISSQEKDLIIYDGYFHEIFNEPEKELVFEDVLKWLNAQLSK